MNVITKYEIDTNTLKINDNNKLEVIKFNNTIDKFTVNGNDLVNHIKEASCLGNDLSSMTFNDTNFLVYNITENYCRFKFDMTVNMPNTDIRSNNDKTTYISIKLVDLIKAYYKNDFYYPIEDFGNASIKLHDLSNNIDYFIETVYYKYFDIDNTSRPDELFINTVEHIVTDTTTTADTFRIRCSLDLIKK